MVVIIPDVLSDVGTENCKGNWRMQVRNVPSINTRYWTAIIFASMCGANAGDFFSEYLKFGNVKGILPLLILFLGILWLERKARSATEAYYWLAIIVLRTMATNIADY